MSLKTFIAGVAKLVATTNVFKVYVASAVAWKDVVAVRVYKITATDAGWRDFWIKSTYSPPPPPPPAPPPPPPPPPTVLSVTITPTSVSGHSSSGAAVVSTPNVTAAASGGTGPYTYHWELISWDASTPPTANTPNAAVTYFTQTDMVEGDYDTAQFRVTAVDALNNFGTATVNASFTTFTRDFNYRSNL